MQLAREVLCKSFIQQFWQLNLCSYKHWHCLDFLHSLLLLLKWKSRNKTKLIIPGSMGNQLVLFSWGNIRTWSNIRKQNLQFSAALTLSTYSWTLIFRTRLIQSPRYFEGRSNSLGFTLVCSVIYYQLFRTHRFFPTP